MKNHIQHKVKLTSLLTLSLSGITTIAHEGHHKKSVTPLPSTEQVKLAQINSTKAMSMTGFAPLSVASGSTAHTDTKFRFIVIADTQAGASGAGDGSIDALTPQIISDAAARNPLFTVFPGDLVGSGTEARWRKWLTDTRALGNERYIVPGNHDLHPTRGAPTMVKWQNVFSDTSNTGETYNGLPWVDALASAGQVGPLVAGLDVNGPSDDQDRRGIDYYFDKGNTRIVCVTTDGKEGTEADWNPPSNLDWFESVMKLPSTAAKTNLIVFTHKPLTFEGFRNNADSGGTAWKWWRAISGQPETGTSKAADALFCGHYHLYRPGRPDASRTNTMEIIVGTGGGGLEGRNQHRFHGFLEVFVDNDRITAWFWGDSNGATNGWSHTEVLDSFIIDPGSGNSYSGQLCRYDFENDNPLDDSSLDVTSKHFPLTLLDGASVVNDTDTARGKVLVTGSDKRATTSNIKDHNLALTGDFTLSLYAKADNASLSGSEGDNVLLSFGGGPPNNTTGSHPDFEINNERNECENYCYILSVNPDGKLRVAWQYRVKQTDANAPTRDRGQAPDANRLQWEVVTSTSAMTNLNQWNRIQVVRNASAKQVTFFVNGTQLGAPISYTHQATGGQMGSLYIGASDRSFAGAEPGVSEWEGRLDDIQIFNNTTGTAGQMLGDLNFDGKVDVVDYATLRKNMGSKLDAHGNMNTFSKGDVDFDGDVDSTDVKLFKKAFKE